MNKNRIDLFRFLFCFLFFLILAGLFYTQVIKGAYYQNLSDKNCIRLLPQAGERGKIYDRAGSIIADNRLSFDLAVIPQELKDQDIREKVFLRLSEIFKLDEDVFTRSLEERPIFPFAPIILLEDIEQRQAIIVEQERLALPGIIIQTNPKRFYPNSKLAAHLLGYVRQIDQPRMERWKEYGYRSEDVVGFGGVEEYYEPYLKAKPGGMQVEVDNRGRLVRVRGLRQPGKGDDIWLSLDIGIQSIIEELLRGKRGAIVVMEVNSGEILALASSPGFDPNLFLSSGANSKRIKSLLTDPQAPLLNRALQGQYPPGSIFKIVVSLAGLETNKVPKNKSFFCDGTLEIGDREFACWASHGRQDLNQAITHSCNIYFYNSGLALGPKALVDYARLLGLGRISGIDLPFEADGALPLLGWRWGGERRWFRGDTANLAIGQGGVLVTPIQATCLIAPFANGGYLVRPHLVKSIGDNEIFSQERVRLMLRKENLEVIRSSLRDVVSQPSGTAHILNSLPLEVAGKTGTAQVAGRASHAWFVGFAPFDNPRIAFCVFLEHGRSSENACRLAKQMLNKMINAGFFDEKDKT